VLRDLNRTAEALESYEGALAIKPDYAGAWYNRGSALRDLQRHTEALASYDTALRLMPDMAAAWVGRGLILSGYLDRPQEALVAYDKALAIQPDIAEAWLHRGGVLQGLKRPQEAIVSYRQALANGGDTDVIRYTLASLGDGTAPAIAPKQFIAQLFDQYSDRFDDILVGALKYQAPDFLFDMIARIVPSRNLDILDLGCGTGLVGSRLHSLARTLTGIDVSPRMIEMARKRGIYGELICGELIEFLQTQSENFDLAVAADVFIYIGDLSAVFAGVRGALRPGGFFAFSVEASEQHDFVLGSSLRYAQSAEYLRRLADEHGFILETVQPQVIRQQDEMDVPGYSVMLRRG
jgi:predicted TPR repeat methyltransferase